MYAAIIGAIFIVLLCIIGKLWQIKTRAEEDSKKTRELDDSMKKVHPETKIGNDFQLAFGRDSETD